MAKLLYTPKEGFTLEEQDRDKQLYSGTEMWNRNTGLYEFPQHDTRQAEFILALFGINTETVTSRPDVGKWGNHCYVVSDKTNPYIISINDIALLYFGDDLPVVKSKTVKTETKHWKRWHCSTRYKKNIPETYFYLEVKDPSLLYKFSGLLGQYKFNRGERIVDMESESVWIAKMDYTEDQFNMLMRIKREKEEADRRKAEEQRKLIEYRKTQPGFCDCCGQPALLVVDPYRSDMYGETTKMWLCQDCYESRMGDI